MPRSPCIRSRAARFARLALIAVLGAGAFSCAEIGPATRAPASSASGHVAARGSAAEGALPSSAAQAEALGPAAATAGSPGGAEGAGAEVPEGSGQALPAATLPPPATTDLIAIVLPLDEPAFARAATAVRDGFLDSAQLAGAKDRCVVIGYGRDGVVAGFADALARGVRVAVGPLVRSDLAALAASGATLPWTLALNQLEDTAPLPPAIYTFPLSVDSDARLLARQARADGAHTLDIVEGETPLMHRLAKTFAGTWTSQGGSAPADFAFDASPQALVDLRDALAKSPPDAVLLALNSRHASLVKPFLGTVATYASALVFERPTLATAHDLDGIRVAEIPWLLTPDAPRFAALTPRDTDSDALERLYAFGFDAFHVAVSFRDGPPQSFDLDGATGHITLGPGRRFVREAALGVYRDGQLVPLDASP
ncbi:MAG: penicillin-binding protein activator [Proteobacteria bacterium]|nr:penicillin-binding protein activator [Pseudomonadota bacterium]